MTWLDLYNFLHKKANNIQNPDPKMWNSEVVVHDLETGEEFSCDTWEIGCTKEDYKLVLGINFQKEEN